MAKKRPEPFWRAERNCYFVQIGKKQIRLATDEPEAWRLYHELMARPPEQAAIETSLAPADPFAVEVMDAFLEWTRLNRAERTYEWYRENIQRLVDRIPSALTVEQLKPYHVTDAMAAFPNWGNNTKNDFISAVKRAFNWALEEERIERNPLAKLKKPPREAGEMAVSPDQYATLLAAVKTPAFRDLLELAWETGARLQELRKIEARFVEPGRVVLPPTKAKGKKNHRVIYLTERAEEIIGRLAQANPSGPIVLNSDGNPWKKNAVNCVFFRLEKRLGMKFHLGALRKGFATEALKAGIDTVTVGALLGHRDGGMVSRVYGKIQQDPEFMAQSLKRSKRARPVKAAGDSSPEGGGEVPVA
jgi:integrase